VLVSLLEAHEAEELGLANEAASCRTRGLAFLNLPVPDLGVPRVFESLGQFVADVVRQLRTGKGVAVHCRQSVGRSGLFAVAIGIAAGLESPTAINMVSTARGVQVPETALQLAWLRDHATQLAKLVA
jgi:protein-tyrosine phosphatase